MSSSIVRRGFWKEVLRGWYLLAFVGFGYVPGGALLAWLTWRPTPGPYAVGERYPYGGYVEAWQVSLAFAFLAFGVLFVTAALVATRSPNRFLWYAMLASFALMWFPHFWLGVAFVFSDPSMESLGNWTQSLVPIFTWMAIAAAGFVFSWRDLRRLKIQRGAQPPAGVS